MAPINEARTEVSNAWSGEVTAATNITEALKGYAAALDNNGLGLVAIINADRNVPYSTFEGRYGNELFSKENWDAARKEIATLKKLYREYYSKGAQTFEAWLQNFRLKLMLTTVKGDSAKLKMSAEAKKRSKANADNRNLCKALEKMYSKGKSKSAGQSDTTKLKNKIKSATNRLIEIKQLFADIKELEKSETTKSDITEYLIDYVTQLEANLVAVTGGE
jgi:hypothetical protein